MSVKFPILPIVDPKFDERFTSEYNSSTVFFCSLTFMSSSSACPHKKIDSKIFVFLNYFKPLRLKHSMLLAQQPDLLVNIDF